MRSHTVACWILLAVLGVHQTASGQVSITGDGLYTQNFDSLAASGTTNTWSNNTTLAGWSLYRQPAPGTAITTYRATAGTDTTGSFYSFGTGTDAERALGGLGSGGAYFGSPGTGTVAGWIAVGFTNNTGAAVSSVTVSFDGEQWRNGGNTSAQTMVLEYGFGSTFESVATWTAPGGNFDFTSPIVGATAAALDGNAAVNREAGKGGILNSLAFGEGDTMWLRWVEVNDAGNDHGLAIDNFSFQITPVPEPGSVLAIGAGVMGLGAYVRRKWRAGGNSLPGCG